MRRCVPLPDPVRPEKLPTHSGSLWSVLDLQCIYPLLSTGLLDPDKGKEQYRLKHEAVVRCLLNIVDSEARGSH